MGNIYHEALEHFAKQVEASEYTWFDMPKEADCIEKAVSAVLDEGYRTADIMPADVEEAQKCVKIGCKEMGKQIRLHLRKEK